jgi:hypothetical protein
MTSRFSAVDAGLHRGASGFRARESREPAKPSGPPAMPLGSPAIPLRAICDPSGASAMASALPAMPSRSPPIPSASSDDPSRPLAVGLRGRLVDHRLKGEAPVGIAAPFVSPRLVRGPQRVAFVEPFRERTYHRGVKQSVTIPEWCRRSFRKGIGMGPRSLALAFEGCGEGSHSPVGDSVDLDGGTQLSRTEERCRGFVEPLRREGKSRCTTGSSPPAEPTRVLH